MNAERIMIKKWKKNIYGFLVILLAQSIGVALADMLLKEFVEQAFVRQVIAFVIVGIFAAADASFVFNRIFLLRRLLDKTPVRCRLEDIFLMPYKDDKKIRYVPYPIVRSLEDHKLYLTYGEYSLLGFTAVFNYSDRRNIQCAVYKDDKTPVRLGDIVDAAHCIHVWIQKRCGISSINRTGKQAIHSIMMICCIHQKSSYLRPTPLHRNK